MLKQQSDTSLTLGFRNSADLLFSTSHTFTIPKMRLIKESEKRRKEDKDDNLTPLSLDELRNEGEEE